MLPTSALAGALDSRRTTEADIESWVYEAPTGTPGLAQVRKECNEQPLVVTSERTFAQGASVFVGSNTGRPGKTIIAGAPPGQAGRSRFGQLFPPAVRLGGSSSSGSSCPAPITGKSYLALYFADDGIVHAWRYLDGVYQEAIGSIDVSGEPWNFPGGLHPQRVHTMGDVVVLQGRGGSHDHAVTLNFLTEAAAALDLSPLDQVGGPVWDGASDVYWVDTEGGSIQLYSAPVGASGVVDLVSAAVGTPLDPGDRTLSFPTALCHAGGSAWQVPGFDFTEGDAVCFAYFSGGGWNAGLGRPLATGGIGSGFGYAVSGGRSTRIGFGEEPSSDNLALMPAGPGGPEMLLLPSDWIIGGGADHSVAPGGAQIALYPVTGNKFLRVQARSTTYETGCPMPAIDVEEGPLGQPAFMLCRD